MENKSTDLQQRLNFSKLEQLDDGGCRGWGGVLNKPLLAVSLLFYLYPNKLMWMCVLACACHVTVTLVGGSWAELKCFY